MKKTKNTDVMASNPPMRIAPRVLSNLKAVTKDEAPPGRDMSGQL